MSSAIIHLFITAVSMMKKQIIGSVARTSNGDMSIYAGYFVKQELPDGRMRTVRTSRKMEVATVKIVLKG